MDADAIRILDASLNRAREGLRVIEDYARFVVSDTDAAAAAKGLRHAVRGIAELVGPEAALASRDVGADVGRGRTTPQERARGGAAQVVGAAFGRLTEALRSIAEYGKLLNGAISAVAEALRFRAYELEQRVMLRADPRRRFRAAPLYVLITESECRGDWLALAERIATASPIIFQLREKALPDVELLRRAARLRELTLKHGGLLVINDRPDIARLVGADGVHVGQDDLAVRDARSVAGGRMLVGKSTHTLEQVDAAIAENPDYIAVGPMYASATKPQAHIPGPALLAAAAARTSIPLVAIGGITPQRAAGLFEAGANSVCVCAAVAGAHEPAAAARAFLAIAAEARRPPAAAT
jgi:thiamine-phosphate pyrophosphorylase